mgnify:CR=1 FL=1
MNVLIIDDDHLVCMSLKTILEADPEIHVIGIGYKGEETLKLYNTHLPDVLLMDIRMKKMSGIEAAEILLTIHQNVKVLFLTTFSDDDYIIKALRIGAKGFILKQHFEGIVPAIKAVFLGQRVFGDEIVSKIPALLEHNVRQNFSHNLLTEKETEILQYVAQGLSNHEISETLFLSKGTVRNYISIMLDKLQLRDRTQLAIFYYKGKSI